VRNKLVGENSTGRNCPGNKHSRKGIQNILTS